MRPSPHLYHGPLGPFLEPNQDRLLVWLALTKTRGIYQRYLVTGWEQWDGVSLTGKAKTDKRYVMGYYNARKHLQEKLEACGIVVTTHTYAQPKVPVIYPRKPKPPRPPKKDCFGCPIQPAPPKVVMVRVSFSLLGDPILEREEP